MNKPTPLELARRHQTAQAQVQAAIDALTHTLRKACSAHPASTLQLAGLPTRAIGDLRAGRKTSLSLERTILVLAALGHHLKIVVDGEVILDTAEIAAELEARRAATTN